MTFFIAFILIILLDLTIFLTAFALSILITYFLIKLFNHDKKFWEIIKPIVLYEVGVFSFFFIDPASLTILLASIIPHIILFILYFLIIAISLFFIFEIVMRKYLLLDIKKSILVFLIMFLVTTPFIFYSSQQINIKIEKRLPIFEKWEYKKYNYTKEQTAESWIKLNIINYLIKSPDKLSDIFLEGKILRNMFTFLHEI